MIGLLMRVTMKKDLEYFPFVFESLPWSHIWYVVNLEEGVYIFVSPSR
jgi:hypothetical protein